MCELVFFIVAIRQIHEYTEIVLTGSNANAGSCEFGADLVKATGRDATLGTIDVESRNWRMMGCLFSEEADFGRTVRRRNGAICRVG